MSNKSQKMVLTLEFTRVCGVPAEDRYTWTPAPPKFAWLIFFSISQHNTTKPKPVLSSQELCLWIANNFFRHQCCRFAHTCALNSTGLSTRNVYLVCILGHSERKLAENGSKFEASLNLTGQPHTTPHACPLQTTPDLLSCLIRIFSIIISVINELKMNFSAIVWLT